MPAPEEAGVVLTFGIVGGKEAEQRAAGVSPDMIRLSVGIENVEDILADLDQAIERATGKVSVGAAG